MRVALRVLAVPLVTLALLCGAGAYILHLQSEAVETRDAQSRLLSLRLDLMQLRDVPYDAEPGSGTTPAEARGELTDALAHVRGTLHDLERSPGLPDAQRVLAHFGVVSGALWRQYRAIRAHDSAASDIASNQAAAQTYATGSAMQKAAASYRTTAERARRRSVIGSAVVLALLFCAFTLFYVRSAVRRRRTEQLVATLRETEAARARLFSAVVDAGEEERMLLAADLHDGPIQKMSMLALTLDLIAGRARRGEVETMPAALDDARGLASEQISALRSMMVSLRPSALAEAGVEAALRDYVAGFSRRTGIETRLESRLGGRRFDAAFETALYRVVQEALTNVEKHANARRAAVTLTEHGGMVDLRVEDDGVGFEPRSEADLLRADHFGLVGLRERVERIGGTSTVSSGHGEGTVIVATLPVAAPA